jgi:hypothetical protein
MAAVLSVRTMWVGFHESVGDEAMLVIVNEGMPTELRLAVGPWCSIEGGTAMSKRGAVILRKQFGTDLLPTVVEEGAERPHVSAEQIKQLNS